MVNLFYSYEHGCPNALTTLSEVGAYAWTESLVRNKIKGIRQSSEYLDLLYRIDDEGTLPDSTQKEKNLMNLFSGHSMFQFLLHTYPILRIDSVLESLIMDTKISKNSIAKFKMPYPGFFLDKIFEIEDGFIMGVAMFEEIALITKLNKDGMPFLPEYIKEKKKLIDTLEETEGNNHRSIFLNFFHVTNKRVSYVTTDVTNVLKPPKHMYVKEFKDLCTTLSELSQKALQFVLNVCILIINHVDLKNPTNSKRDVRVIPYYPNEDSRQQKQDNHISTIRVFGALKEYTKLYNKERRKHHNTNLDAVLVRGYYRYLGSERYTNKQGEYIWVYPYIRGIDKELYQKIINITV